MATNTNESAHPIKSQDRALSLAQALAQDDSPADQNSGAQASPRTDAIGIEIPVALYASRYSAAGRGASKTPPPVREETRTVIVFAQGAVVRLTATLSVGEMVVLTNQQTGADVLCRVGAVKTQPGVQNYVDLEFTQRAPGFWEDRLAAGASSRGESLSFEPAAAATLPAIQEPTRAKQESDSPAWLRTEPAPASVSLSPGAAPVSRPAPAAIPRTSLATEPPRSLSAGASQVAPRASNAVLGMSAGLRLTQTDPLPLSGRQMEWAKQSAPKSKKGLWAGIAAVAVAGILAGGFLLSHRGQSVSSDAGITVAAPNAPPQAAASAPVDEPQATAEAESAPSTTAGPVEKPRWVPETPKPEQLQAEQAHAEDVAPAPTPALPRRSAIPVGNLAAPIAKKPVMASLSEAPPVLVTQDNGAEGVLRSGVLSGASRVEAPTAFAGVASSPVRPVGGRIQVPKLISSPEPLYPATARTQLAEGIVAMDAVVDATGKVTEVKVISGPVVLRQAAIDAVRKWKYEPARLDGQPTTVHTNVNISFKLR